MTWFRYLEKASSETRNDDVIQTKKGGDREYNVAFIQKLNEQGVSIVQLTF